MAVVQPAAVASVNASQVASVFGRTGVVVAANGDYAGVVATHLTGAVAATRYVGGTASGAPVAGTFLLGDFVVTQDGHVFVCTVAGTPGTWVDAGGAAAVTSVFGRVGVVVATTGDYTAAQVGALAATSTLDSIATAHATAADVAMNGHKITGAANGTAAGDVLTHDQVLAANAVPVGDLAAGSTVNHVVGGTGPAYFIPHGTVLAYGTYAVGNITTTGTTFAAGVDVLASALSFTADGVSDYLLSIAASACYNGTAADGVFLSANLDAADAGRFAQLPEVVNNTVGNLCAEMKLPAPSAGAHTVNVRMLTTGAGTANIEAGAGGAGVKTPVLVRVSKL